MPMATVVCVIIIPGLQSEILCPEIAVMCNGRNRSKVYELVDIYCKRQYYTGVLMKNCHHFQSSSGNFALGTSLPQLICFSIVHCSGEAGQVATYACIRNP